MREIEAAAEEPSSAAWPRRTAAAPRSAPSRSYGRAGRASTGRGRRRPSSLTELVDAGYDGTLVSEDSAGSVLYEMRLGPYDDQAEAERAAEAMREAFGLVADRRRRSEAEAE